jgi:3',5'-cyclic AMP phosphodiesterase CpdA
MPLILPSEMDRRLFLQTTLAGCAALVVSGCRSVVSSTTGLPELPLAFLSDTHIPGDRTNEYRGFKPWENLHTVVSQVVAARPEGVVLNGDAARLEGKPEDYRELRTLLGPLSTVAPVYIGLGNHDDRAGFLAEFKSAPGEHPAINGRHITVLEHEVVRVIMLDSLLYTNRVAGLLGRAQRNWLAHYLPLVNDRPAVLVLHHTLDEGDGDLLDVDRLFALVRPHRHVRAIFYGHSHVYALWRRQGMHMVNLPSTAYNFRDQDPVGWVEARFQPEGVTLILHVIGGHRGSEGQTTFLSWR